MHAYLFFVKEKRAQIGIDNPGKTFKELMNITSQTWANMPPNDKARYEQMAVSDRKRHEEESRLYHEALKTGMISKQSKPI